MYEPDQNASPLNHIPTAVVLVMLVLAAVEIVFQAAEHNLVGGPDAVGWRLGAITDYGFFSSLLNWMIDNRSFPLAQLIRFVTYPFVSDSFGNLIFGFVLVLALGKMVAEIFSQGAFLLIFFASTIVGALAYGLLVDTNQPLTGPYPAAYGLIGGFTFILWMRARAEGSNPLRAFSLIGFLLGIQVYFGLVYGGGYGWVAEVAGFVTGFGLSFVVAPDGMDRMKSWLDQVRKRG